MLKLDPKRANHVTIVGRKGTGKSHLARMFWDGWPGDRLVIDPTGDVELGDDKTNLTDPLPSSWPAPIVTPSGERRRQTLRYKADPGSATYRDDLDRAAGLAFGKGDALLWVDEIGELTRANSTPPAMRRILHQSRHRNLSLLCCGPRPIDIDPLVLAQADYLGIFHTPNPGDRKRLADAMGLELDTLEEAHDDRQGDHGFLWWDAVERELLNMPPLPAPSSPRARPAGRRFTPDEDLS